MAGILLINFGATPVAPFFLINSTKKSKWFSAMIKFRQFILERDMASYNELKLSDITRRGRDPIVVDKIQNGKGFLAKKGEFFADKNDRGAQELAATISNPPRGYKVKVKGKLNGRNAELTFPNDFLKDASLGGKGAGSGTAAEDAALTAFRLELEKCLEHENQAEIKIKVGGRVVEVSGIESTPGTPKSDFHLVNAMGQEVAWLSHKDGTKASQFQQYGGLTADWNKHYSNNKDVEAFIKQVQELKPDGLQRGDSYWRYVKDKKVAQLTIWGPDFGKGRGRNNVDEFHQGTMKLKKSGSVYEITSVHKEINGAVASKSGSGNYTPIYVARFTSDRGFNKGGGIKNARVGVFARDYVSGKAKEI